MSEPQSLQAHERGVVQPSNGHDGSDSYGLFKQLTGSWLSMARLQGRILDGAFRSMWGVELPDFIKSPDSWINNNQSLRGQSVADWMRHMGESSGGSDELCNTFNNKLWTHNNDGSLNRVLSKDVRRLFEPGTEWPQLFLTTNHALASDHEDLSGIMRGFRKLAQDTFNLPVSLIRNVDEHTQADASQTLMISAVSAERNPWFNGAELLDRLQALRHDIRRQHGGAPTTLEHISPAAIRLGKLMLKLLVEDANSVDVDAKQYTARADTAGLPLKLRADAPLVAQHLHLMGYSKGGNTVTDALRYLVLEMRAGGIEQAEIKNVVRHIGLVCVAAGEVPLTQEEKNFGMRRMSVINEHDVIANHFRAGDEHHYSIDDDFYKIHGVEKDLGHNPRDALGYYEEGQASRRGFLHDDPAVHDRLRCYFASCFGKSAITNVILTPAFDGLGYRIELEFAPGVDLPAIGQPAFDRLNQAFDAVGLEGFAVICDAKTRRCYASLQDDPVIHHPESLMGKIEQALKLAESEQLLISKEVYAELAAWKPRPLIGGVQHEGAAKAPERNGKSY